MVRPEKLAAVADIAEEFRRSTAALVTEYRGLSMTQLTTLRRALGPQATYRVAKNTLISRAARDAGVQGMDELFIGPTAIAFVHGEPVTVARALRDFAREHPALVIKGGYLEGRPLSGTEVTQIADLDSREVLLAKLAGAMKGSLAKAARLFAEPAARVARLASALRDKRQEQPG
jgi:large subunit ribosomal protein L10